MSSALVVIPTLNESFNIKTVIESLCSDLPNSIDFTFVVVDGGSQDGTQDIVEQLAQSIKHMHLLHNPKKLQSAGVNLAVTHFGKHADFLIRCDAHAIYPPQFITRLLETITSSGADSVVVPMDSIGQNCLQKAIAWVSDTIVGSGGSAHRGGKLSGFVDHGHHAAFRVSTFLQVGGYAESFSHNEDAEFDCRQRKLGAKIYLDSGIRLQYYPRATASTLWKQYFGYGKGRSRTIRRHPDSMRLRQLAVPLHFLTSLLCLVFGTFFPLVLILPILYFSVLTAVSILLAVKHRSWCGLLAGFAAFVMHTSWSIGFYWGVLSLKESVWSVKQVLPLEVSALD